MFQNLCKPREFALRALKNLSKPHVSVVVTLLLLSVRHKGPQRLPFIRMGIVRFLTPLIASHSGNGIKYVCLNFFGVPKR